MPAVDPPVEVRPATAADVAAQVDLMERVAAEGRWIGREAPIDREQLTGSYRASVDDPARLSLVATVDGSVVGSLGLDDDASRRHVLEQPDVAADRAAPPDGHGTQYGGAGIDHDIFLDDRMPGEPIARRHPA